VTVLAALAAVTLLRLVVAAMTPLSPDEAYYWIWSRALAGGYYDHPPMVALWIRLGTYLCGDTALGVRLLAPLSLALASVALAHAGALLTGDRKRGLMAAIFVNATLAFGVGAVSMTPDTPLLFFWILSLTALARFIASNHGAWLLAVGAFTGLAMVSKYTALFFGASVALWLFAVPSMRAWLYRPWPWLAGVLAVAIFVPVIAWNATHEWVGFIKQGSRFFEFRPAHAAYYVIELVAGQVGMLTPLLFALACAGTWMVLRRRRDPSSIFLLLLTLLPLPVFLAHTLSDRVQGNWPAIIYPSAMLLGTLAWPRLHRPAIVLGLALTAPVYLQAAWPILPIPTKLDPSMKRLAGWEQLAADIEVVRHDREARFVATDSYAIAAMLAWHGRSDVPVIGADRRWSNFNLPHPNLSGQPGLLVRSIRQDHRFNPNEWRAPIEITTVNRARGQTIAETYRLYRIAGPPTDPNLVTLPQR